MLSLHMITNDSCIVATAVCVDFDHTCQTTGFVRCVLWDCLTILHWKMSVLKILKCETSCWKMLIYYNRNITRAVKSVQNTLLWDSFDTH